MNGNEHVDRKANPETRQSSPIILFDFAGVIVKNGFWDWVSTFTTDEKDITQFEAVAKEADLGILTEEAYMQRVAVLSHRKPDDVRSQLYSAFTPNEDVIDTVKKLREKGYPLVLVTNFMKSIANSLLDKHDLRQHFSRIFISADMGMVKPSPQFFRQVMKELQTQPADVIFIDDSQKNIDGALGENMQRSWLFTNAESLKARFQEIQLLPPDPKPAKIPQP